MPKVPYQFYKKTTYILRKCVFSKSFAMIHYIGTRDYGD